MLTIGLTGSIATGKSRVLAMFEALGVPVFSADEAVHRLYAGAAAPGVERLFPGTVADGVVDRAALSRRLVAEPSRIAALEALVHPMVRAEIAGFLEGARAAGADMAVVDIPLLFEGKGDWRFDRVVVTACDEPIQRQRALARPGMSVEKLDAILARQMPQAEKRARADHVIDTSGPLARTEADVAALVAALRAAGREA
jgi:dephospho-CoA kinase